MKTDKTVPVKAFVRIRSENNDFEFNRNTIKIYNSSNQLAEYRFERIFGPQNSTSDIFKELKPTITKIESHDITILAYGQTGAGKTFTMSGSESAPGLIPLIIREMLLIYKIKISFIEIYNERIIDLLDNKEKILREGNGGIIVQGILQREVATLKDFTSLNLNILKMRKTGETKLNSNSSRSHLIIRINVNERYFNLVDLAGSENNRKTGNEGIRMEESLNINRSLFVLSKVVNAIVSKEVRIPYRDSKLTRLLQDSLGGVGECIIIGNVLDNSDNLAEIINTLNFASKSRNILNSKEQSKKKEFKENDLFLRLQRKAFTNHNIHKVSLNKGNIKSAQMRSEDKKCIHTRPDTINKGNIKSAQIGSEDKKCIHTRPDTINKEHINTISKNINPAVLKDKSNKAQIQQIDSSKSSFINKSCIEMTPVTKQKSLEFFINKAKDYEDGFDYRNALETYKTIKKFDDSEFINDKILQLQAKLKKSKIKFSEFEVLEILNSGNFIEIKRLDGIGDKRAQNVVDFVLGGHIFESIDELKMIFSEKVVLNIINCIEY